MARSASSGSRRNGWSRSALWSSRDARSRTPWLRSSPRMLNCWRSGVDSPRKRGPRRSERTTIQHPRGTPERLTMGLTLSEETSNRVSEVVLPPRLGRNEACHCGSGSKYKRCCREQDEALRDGCYSTLRCVAMDGWEPFASYDRHCPHCLVRKVKVKRRTGDLEEVDQYYHRYVVAMLLGSVIDVVLGIEPVLNEEARRDIDSAHVGHEGELTAARRLIDSLHDTYGGFIDAFVLDALYANGPVMTQLEHCGYGGFLVLKKENNEPLKEALTLWQIQGRCEIYDNHDRKEHVEFWDVDDVETLDTYAGKVRVIRAVVTKPDQDPSTWCFAIIGKRARQLGRRTALQIIRARWHIEDTGFNQWIQYWNFGHVFRHSSNALMAVLLLWTLAFNLLQLFVYRRLGRCRRPKDPTDTIRHIVEVMLRDVATLPAPIPWATFLLNTS